MIKTYRIVDAPVKVGKKNISKQNIEYYIDGKLEAVEFYSADGVVGFGVVIRDGYTLES